MDTEESCRVLLVATNMVKTPYPVAPVGVCLVAETLSRAGFEAQVFDSAFATPGQLEQKAKDFDPHFVGLGIRNIDDVVMQKGESFLPAIKERIVEPLRQATAAPMFVGGCGFGLFAKEILELLELDYGVVGEGERTAPALLEALRAGRNVEGIASVVTRDKTAAPINTAFCPPGELCRSRVYKWINFKPYVPRGSYPVQTRRGCARKCVYCTYPRIEGPTERFRPPEAVVDEIEEAADHVGDVTFELVDSNFNDPPGYARKLCETIIARGLKIRLRAMGINPAGTSPELVALMGRAGFAQIDCTADTASETMLRSMRKAFSRRALEATAKALRDQDMPTMWFFLFGGPGESEQTLAESLEFIDGHINPEDMVYMAGGLRIYPGTELHRIAIEERALKAEQTLLLPRYYVSPHLDAQGLTEWIEQRCASRANCVPAWQTGPGPEMIGRAIKLREEQGLKEPMFRTLLRLRAMELNAKQ